MLSRVRDFLLVFVIAAVLRVSRWFWRIEYVGGLPKGTRLYAHFHGDELLLVPLFARRQWAVMASRSRDGETMANLLTRLGYYVVRGSSSRGGAGGLKGLVDAVRGHGRTAAIAVDGPRGPVFEVKPGILFLAQATGLPITPAGVAVSRSWPIPGAWNQGFFPKPFCRGVIVFGEELAVPADLPGEDLESLRQELQTRLWTLREAAKRRVQETT